MSTFFYFVRLLIYESFWGIIGLFTNLFLLILLPILMCVAAIANYIGTDSIRKRKGQIQVPTDTYEDPQTGKKVVLIGVMHIADTIFYEETMKYINALEFEMGYRVLYELVSSVADPNPSLRKMTREEIISELSNAKMEISDQSEVIVPRDSWKNTDITMEELYYYLEDASVRKFFNSIYKKCSMSIEKYMDSNPHEIDTLFIDDIYREVKVRCFMLNLELSYAPVRSMIQKLASCHDEQLKEVVGIIIDLRNKVAFAGIINELQHCNNVVSIWGAEHLSGIGELLKKAGFKRIERYWVPAYTVKNYPLSYIK